MRRELADAAAKVLAGMDPTPIRLTDDENSALLQAANLVTLARTAVMRDSRGEPIDAHAPEMPTRFAKQLAQIVRGGAAIGMDRVDAMRLAMRCARDSIPPLRLAILEDLAVTRLPKPGPYASASSGHGTPSTVSYAHCNASTSSCAMSSRRRYKNGNENGTVWNWTLQSEIDPHESVPEMYVAPLPQGGTSTYISGQHQTPPPVYIHFRTG